MRPNSLLLCASLSFACSSGDTSATGDTSGGTSGSSSGASSTTADADTSGTTGTGSSGSGDEASDSATSEADGSSSTGPELPRECDDGIDNDGDGFTDWQRDLGCWGPADHGEAALPRDEEDGFTTFEIAADSVAIYVSNDGSDDADGLTPETAVATIVHAAELVRDGEHDFILLHRGDTWRGAQLGRFLSGRDAEHPLVVAGWGDALELPRVELAAPFIDHDGHARSNVAIVGVHFVAYPGDPDDEGFTGAPENVLRYVGGGSGLLVEGCHLEYGEIVIGSYGEGNLYSGIEIRRNVIERAYHANTCQPGNPNGNYDYRPSGIYATHVEALTIEGNVFDHNGWNPEEVESACATIYNHNLYLNGNDIVIRDNVLARASSIGIKLRSDTTGEMTGTVVENNLFVEGEIGISVGGNTEEPHRFVDTTITRNVMTDIGRDTPTGRGLAWGIEVSDNDGLALTDNLLLNTRFPELANGYGVQIGGGSGRDYEIAGNLFWRLGDRALQVFAAGGHESIAITDNELVDPELDAVLVDHRGGFGAFDYSANRYHASAPADAWFSLGNQGETDIAGWRSASGEADAQEIALPAYDERDLEGYATAIGAGSTLEELLALARQQTRLTWREDLTAPVINDWIRAGFAR